MFLVLESEFDVEVKSLKIKHSQTIQSMNSELVALFEIVYCSDCAGWYHVKSQMAAQREVLSSNRSSCHPLK